MTTEDFSPQFPRFIFGSTLFLDKRQANTDCNAGESSCRAINITGCCPNDNYCYINPQGTPKCCADESRCDDPCPLSQYQCTVSATTTCCPRACPASLAYQCPQSLGGGCCSIGSACLPSDSCISTLNPTSTSLSTEPNPANPTATATTTGCTTGQFSCASSDGGGCCASGLVCTSFVGSLYCAGTPSGAGSTARATRTAAGGGAGAVDTGGITSPPPSAPATATGTPSATLGKGAKAGIGIGVTLSAVLLVSALTYFILAHRRNRNAAITAGAVTADADAASQSNHTPQTGPSPTAPRSDHLGPVAQTGPFSQRGGASGVAWVVEMRGTAVPVEPQGPDDIAMAVEIAESNPITKVKDEGSSGSPLKPAGDRFELE